MKKKDFKIGLEFYCGGNKWYCADIGSKIIIGVQEIGDIDGTLHTGVIFSEYDFPICSTDPKDLRKGNCPGLKGVRIKESSHV